MRKVIGKEELGGAEEERGEEQRSKRGGGGFRLGGEDERERRGPPQHVAAQAALAHSPIRESLCAVYRTQESPLLQSSVNCFI